MAEKLDEKEITTTEELFWAKMYQLDAVTQLFIEKGIISEQEFSTKLKQAQAERENSRSVKQ